MKLDLVVSGVAGQGVVTFAKVLTNAALKENFDAHHLTHSAISQLEGPVRAHIRIGTPAGPSPKVARGRADVVVGFDRLEAIHTRPFLKKGGNVIIADGGMLPLLARTESEKYPSREELEKIFSPEEIIWIPIPGLLKESGQPALIGAVMMGALCAVSRIVERDNIVEALREELPALADIETDAFFEGYNAVTGEDH